MGVVKIYKKIEVFGDSLLKGVQINSQNMHYHVDNNIDIDGIEKTHSLSIRNFAHRKCVVNLEKSIH